MKKYIIILMVIITIILTIAIIIALKKENIKIENEKQVNENTVVCEEINISENYDIDIIENMKQNESESKDIINNTESISDSIKLNIENKTKVEVKPKIKTEITKDKENSTPVIQETPSVEIETKSVEETKPVKETEDEIVKSKEQEQTNTEVGAKYIVNNEMINKMKIIIENNPSEDMKTYGYNVTVDSSITTLTNQFTFTEKRILDKVKLRFGTIKIYAQDYYNNGEFICTQCFIL